jgi:dGTPase
LLVNAVDRRERFETEPKKFQDIRESAERDYDRILYSSALRRLGGVTQVVAAHEGHVFHNRLTHSLRVSQLARRLAQKLIRKSPSHLLQAVGGVDQDVAEAAGLAHDLGHPPFGHIAEDTLRQCVEKAGDFDAFEGNAQSFRIVTKLALSSPQVPGLNLTRATLNGLLKYPWTRQSQGYEKTKYGLYHSERAAFDFARKFHPNDKRRTAEAEIMDWADDVTYAVHDIEDFYRARLIPLDRLASLRDNYERQRFFDGMYTRPDLTKQLVNDPRADLEEAFAKVVEPFPISEPYTGTFEQRSRLRYFSSALIGQFINAIELQQPSNPDQPFVKIARLQRLQVKILKALTWYYVIYNPALATQQFGQRRIIHELFGIFCEAAKSTKDEERNIIPFAFRDAVRDAGGQEASIARVVADLIAGMTEQALIKLHKRLTGADMGSVLDYVHGN